MSNSPSPALDPDQRLTTKTPNNASETASIASTKPASVGTAAAPATNVNEFGKVADPHTFVTTTLSVSALCAGVTAVIVVAFTTTIEVAALPPIVTPVIAALVKFVPVIVTGVPPAVEPEVGAILVTVGKVQPAGATFLLA